LLLRLDGFAGKCVSLHALKKEGTMKTAIPKIPRKIKRGLGTRNRGIKGYSTRF